MPFGPDTAKQIAHLARLNIDDQENNSNIQEDLNRIMALVDQIVSANTDGIEPMAHPFEMKQTLRLDVVSEQNQREVLLALAPKSEAGLYLVPLVIE